MQPRYELFNQRRVFIHTPYGWGFGRHPESGKVDIINRVGCRCSLGNRPYSDAVASPAMHQYEGPPLPCHLIMKPLAIYFDIFF